MFQPAVKLEFVRRYCHPENGWQVHVDIDPSEEGRTGGATRTPEAAARRARMVTDAVRVRDAFEEMGVSVGAGRQKWMLARGLPVVEGDRDILAFHQDRHVLIVAEVEGESSGQPEQKLYKAIGQAIMAESVPEPRGWTRRVVVVVCGGKMVRHLQRASALGRVGITGVAVNEPGIGDTWFFGKQPLM